MSNSLNNLGEDMKKAGLFSSQHMLLRTALYLNFALIATLLVEGAGFEPAKPKRLIYSQMGLTAPQPLL